MTWGHSPVERVVDFAVAARAERLALFHHDPLRSDDAVDRLVDLSRARVADAGSSLDVFAAFEGQVIELAARAPSAQGLLPAAEALGSVQLEGPATILIVDDDAEIRELLSLTLKGDGSGSCPPPTARPALRSAAAERGPPESDRCGPRRQAYSRGHGETQRSNRPDDVRRWTMERQGTILVGTIGQGVMMSADGGESWTRASVRQGMHSDCIVKALQPDPWRPGSVYAGTDMGPLPERRRRRRVALARHADERVHGLEHGHRPGRLRT